MFGGYELMITTALLLFTLIYISRWISDLNISRFLFVLTPFIYIILFILDSQVVSFLPHSPDSIGFRIALNTAPSNIDFGTAYENFSKLNAPLRVLNANISTYIMLNSAMFVLGATLCWKSWVRYSNWESSISYLPVFFLSLSFWPSALAYIPNVLREGQVLFFWGLSLYCLSILYRNPSWVGGWLYLSISSYGLLLLRKELIPAILLFIFLIYIHEIDYSISTKLMFGTFSFIILYSGILLLGLTHLLSSQKLAHLRMIRGEAHTNSYTTNVDWNTWVDVLPDLFPLLVKFLLSPITVNPTLEWASAIADAIYVIGILFFSFVAIIKSLTQKKSCTLVWILAVFIVSSGFALVSVSPTGAPRWRMPLILLLQPAAVAVFSDFARSKVQISI